MTASVVGPDAGAAAVEAVDAAAPQKGQQDAFAEIKVRIAGAAVYDQVAAVGKTPDYFIFGIAPATGTLSRSRTSSGTASTGVMQ